MKTLLIPGLLALAAIAFDQKTPTTAQPQQVVTEFLAAFNAHDVDAMLNLATDDIQWMSVDGAKLAIETKSKAELGEAMTQYFSTNTTVKSQSLGETVSGRFVSIREHVSWKSGSVEQSQECLSVYEVVDGRVRHAWFFPPSR